MKHPRFIQSKPCGEDKFEGQSQKRITNAIGEYIRSTDCGDYSNNIPRIIGLEGGWGTGKSNIIKQLKKLLLDDYYVFEYDAWGHQEDLQRRSFLELLTSELIEEKLLTDKTTIKVNGGNTEEVSWKDKLKYLLARKIETQTEAYPRLSVPMLVLFLATISSPFFMSWGVTLQSDHFWLSPLVTIIPPLVVAIVWIYAVMTNKRDKKWDYLVAIYNDKIRNDICYETISEEEPTVREFKSWMQDVSDSVIKGKLGRKLVVVFDNMDRLPAEKVKQLWSSIHTFFSEDGFENVWAIVPFDEEHLSCAFGESIENNSDKGLCEESQCEKDFCEENLCEKNICEKNKTLTTYFINKTFPIIYRVTPPIISDFKKIFFDFYEEAFGKKESKYKEDVCRIFKLENPNATVRDMIIFINNLVMLKSVRKDEIDILSMAIFVVKKEVLLKDPVHQILQGNYLGNKLSKIVQNNDILQKNISALVYSVSPEYAEQIPLSGYIEYCLWLEKGYDINKFVERPHFLSILSDKVNDADIPKDTLINGLFLLDLDMNLFCDEDRNVITSLWDNIAKDLHDVYIFEPSKKQFFDETFEKLLSRTSNQYQKNIVSFICTKLRTFGEKFDGSIYYNELHRLSYFINKNKLEININDYIYELECNAVEFINYVVAAKDDYGTYKVKTNPDELDTYFAKQIFNDLSNIDIIYYLVKNDTYHFDKTFSIIANTIKQDTQGQMINANNFNAILSVYKKLCGKNPLPEKLNSSQRNNIWSVLASKTNDPRYLEIVTIQIAHGTNVNSNFDEKQIKYIAENIEYYANYGNLLKLCTSTTIPILNRVLTYLTTKTSLNNSKLSIIEILPLFETIKLQIQVSEETLLNVLDRWNKDAEEKITKTNIKDLLRSPNFFKYSIVTKNNLTDHLNKTIVAALSDISCNLLYQQRHNINDYWMAVIALLIDSDYLKPLPDNLTELGKRILNDIATTTQNIPSPNDLLQKIIDKLDRKNTSAHIKNIRDEFCNSKYRINAQLFRYFAPWFEQQGDLLARSADVVRTILDIVIADTSSWDIFISNPEYYADIVNNAGDDASEFKKKVKLLSERNDGERLLLFVEKIKMDE